MYFQQQMVALHTNYWLKQYFWGFLIFFVRSEKKVHKKGKILSIEKMIRSYARKLAAQNYLICPTRGGGGMVWPAFFFHAQPVANELKLEGPKFWRLKAKKVENHWSRASFSRLPTWTKRLSVWIHLKEERGFLKFKMFNNFF